MSSSLAVLKSFAVHSFGTVFSATVPEPQSSFSNSDFKIHSLSSRKMHSNIESQMLCPFSTAKDLM